MNKQLNEKLCNQAKSALSEGFTALSFAIMRNGEIISHGAVGTLDGSPKKPAKTTDLYNVGSISKVYCAAAIMQLCEKGLLKLDDTVCSHLPKFIMRDKRYKQITIRQCLSHSSGLSGTQLLNSFTDGWIENYYDDVYSNLAGSILSSAPGQLSVYCNDGFTLCEMIVEKLTGEKYSDYIRKNITDKIKAYSTCFSDKIPSGHDHAAMNGKPVEALSLMAAGGVNTDMSDMVKFGNAFLQPAFLSDESIAEMAKPQGISSLDGDYFALNYGLGWDSVNLKLDGYDLGEGALIKGGGTFQFSSSLIVLPKYNAVLGISSTFDCAVKPAMVILDLTQTAFEEEFGISIKTQAVKSDYTHCKVPQSIIDNFSGYYTTAAEMRRAEFDGDKLTITHFTAQSPLGEKLIFNYCSDGYFRSENGLKYWFKADNGRKFIWWHRIGLGDIALCQRVENLPPVSEKWHARNGKMYLPLNVHPRDLALDGIIGGVIMHSRCPAENLMYFELSSSIDSSMGMYNYFACKNDFEGLPYMDGSGMASRDQMSPYMYEKDGAEHLFISGIDYICTDNLPILSLGKINVTAGKAGLFRLREKSNPVILSASRARVIIYDKNLKAISDSHVLSAEGDCSNGFVLLCSEENETFEVVKL